MTEKDELNLPISPAGMGPAGVAWYAAITCMAINEGASNEDAIDISLRVFTEFKSEIVTPDTIRAVTARVKELVHAPST